MTSTQCGWVNVACITLLYPKYIKFVHNLADMKYHLNVLFISYKYVNSSCDINFVLLFSYRSVS